MKNLTLHGNKTLTLHGKLAAAAIIAIFVAIGLLIVAGIRHHRHSAPKTVTSAHTGQKTATPKTTPKKIAKPVREIPARFKRRSHMPNRPETTVSGPIDPEKFSPGRDLVYIDDKRVYWESDHDQGKDDECDHSMHKAMETPVRLLIELVSARNGTLEVQDAYRPAGIHNPRSLHKEGRAIDITCDELGLEKLACLAWGAGFDWVLYEAGSRGNGDHVHCSVRSDHKQPQR